MERRHRLAGDGHRDGHGPVTPGAAHAPAREAQGRAEERVRRDPNVLVRLGRRIQEHDVLGLSAEIAYRFLFAVFPLGLFVAALGATLAGVLHLDDPAARILGALGDNLPAPLADSIRPELERVMTHSRPDLLSGGALAALWAATGGTNALIKGMNRAYDTKESRPFVLRYAVAVGLTLLGSLGVIASFVTIVGGALVTQKLADSVGVGDRAWGAVQVLRWPAVFVALTIAVTALYRFGPNLVAPLRTTVLGAAAFAVAWLGATFLLSLYVTRVANYGATYGSLAAVIVLMLWFYVTALLLVAGAEIVVEATRRWAPSALRRRSTDIAAERTIAETASSASEAVRTASDERSEPRGSGSSERPLDRGHDQPDGTTSTTRRSDTRS